VIELLAAQAKFSAAAIGAEAIPAAATPAKSSGAMNLSLAIMFPVYHQDQALQTSIFQRNP
jgi:hypothetical protein